MGAILGTGFEKTVKLTLFVAVQDPTVVVAVTVYVVVAVGLAIGLAILLFDKPTVGLHL